MQLDLIKTEIDSIYKNLQGGYFIEIYDDVDGDLSPLKHLENKYWNGVCISNNILYTQNRKCYIEPYEFNLNTIYKKNAYDDNNVFYKIKKHDRSNLVHVAYINSKESIEISKAFLKGCYEKAMEIEPNAGHWATQVILLIIDTHGNGATDLIKLCEKYFLELYKSDRNVLMFKHEVVKML
jgi:hypothetical protein